MISVLISNMSLSYFNTFINFKVNRKRILKQEKSFARSLTFVNLIFFVIISAIEIHTLKISTFTYKDS